jgi:hypothetical protein
VTLSTQSEGAVKDAWLTTHPKLGITLMDHLFNRMDGSYPNRWRAAFANAQAIQNWREAWSEAFIEEGITPGEVAAAIRICRQMYDWPPSLTEFLRACRPSIDHESAYYEAVRELTKRSSNEDQWSHPAIYWAAAGMAYDLTSNPYVVIKNRWAKALSAELAKRSWEPVPIKAEVLVAPGKTIATPEVAKSFIDRLLGRNQQEAA